MTDTGSRTPTRTDDFDEASLRSDHLLTAAEAARALRVSRSKLYQLIRGGKLPCVRIDRSVRLYSRDVLIYLHRQRETSDQPR